MKFNLNLNNLFLNVSLNEQILFAKHLSMMVKAGIPLVKSLKLIRNQIKKRGFVRILDRLILDVENGQFLSLSLGQFDRVFGRLFINVIKIGEVSGSLAESLAHLAVELNKKRKVRQKIVGALIYPAIIFFVAVTITSVLIFFVLPQILPVFDSLKVELPATTKALIAFVNFTRDNWLAIILFVFALIIAFWISIKIKAVKFFYHRLIFSIPLINRLIMYYNMANITRTLGLLLKSGVTLVEAVEITSESATNLVYKKELTATSELLKKGNTISSHLIKRERFFPPTVSRMIEVGESTGTLEENLFYLSDFYEEQLDDITKNMTSIIEPAMILVMGGMVAFIAIAIITPFYELTSSFGKN